MDIDIINKLKKLGVKEDVISDVKQEKNTSLVNTIEILLEHRLEKDISEDLLKFLRKKDRADLLLLVDRIDNVEDENDVKDILD